MLTETRREQIRQMFVQEIESGVCKDSLQIFDELIDVDLIDADEFRMNEVEICGIFDDSFFTCVDCNWTLPNESSCTADVDETTCSDCYCEDDNDY